MSDDLLLECTTVQASTLRPILESVKDIIPYANWICSEQGLRMTQMDDSNEILIECSLMRKHFDYFKCTENFVFGINLNELHKVIKSAITGSGNCTMSLIVRKHDDHYQIRFVSDHWNALPRDWRLQKKNVEPTEDAMRPIPYTERVDIVPDDFDRYLREIQVASKTFRIVAFEKRIFLCCGDASAFAKYQSEITNGGGILKKKPRQRNVQQPHKRGDNNNNNLENENSTDSLKKRKRSFQNDGFHSDSHNKEINSITTNIETTTTWLTVPPAGQPVVQVEKHGFKDVFVDDVPYEQRTIDCTFAIRPVINFLKGARQAKNVTIHLPKTTDEPDTPLTMEYEVPTLCTVRIILAPKFEPNTMSAPETV